MSAKKKKRSHEEENHMSAEVNRKHQAYLEAKVPTRFGTKTVHIPVADSDIEQALEEPNNQQAGEHIAKEQFTQEAEAKAEQEAQEKAEQAEHEQKQEEHHE